MKLDIIIAAILYILCIIFTAANMSQSARNLVAAVLSNDVIINALVNACASQNPPETRAQCHTSDEKVRSLFNRGRPGPSTTGQAAVYHTNLSMPSTSQQCPTSAPLYNLHPFTRKGPRQKR